MKFRIFTPLCVAAIAGVLWFMLDTLVVLSREEQRATRCETHGGIAVRRGHSYGVVCLTKVDTIAVNGP